MKTTTHRRNVEERTQLDSWLQRVFRTRRDRTHRMTTRRRFLEPLESRRMLAWMVGLSGDDVTFTGDGSADSLSLSVDGGGNLQHDLPITGNLVSSIDLDSATAGEQSHLASTLTSLTVDGGGGSDAVTLGAISLTGSLSITAETISQTAPINVEGPATFDAGTITGTVTLADPANALTAVGASAGTGGVQIHNAGDLTVGCAVPMVMGISAAGSVEIVVGGRLQIDEDVTSTGGDVTLTSTEDPALPGGLYVISGRGNGGSSQLILVDPLTAETVATIGSTGVPSMSGLDFDPTTGTLYGASTTSQGGSGELFTIDPVTAQTTVVGSHGERINDISFDSSGTLYAWARNTGGLHTLSLVDGASTQIGGSSNGSVGIAFDASDTLYRKSKDDLFTIDPATGSVLTTVGDFGPTTNNSLEFDTDDPTRLYNHDRMSNGDDLLLIDPSGPSSSAMQMSLTNVSALASNGFVDGIALNANVTASGSGRQVNIDSATRIRQQTGVVTASRGVFTAVDGLGTSTTPIQTQVSLLDVNNDGDETGTYIENTGGLTLIDLDSSGSSTLDGGGSISASSPLTISNSINHDESFSYTAGEDSSTSGDDLTIDSGAVVTLDSSLNGRLNFFAGDNVAFSSGSIVTTGGGSHRVELRADIEDDVATDGAGGLITQTGAAAAVTTDDLIIVGSAGVGTVAQPIQTSVANLLGRSENGDFLLENNGDLTLGLENFGDVTGDPIGPPLAVLNDNSEILFRVGDNADVEAETSLALRSPDGTLTSIVVGETPAPGFSMGGLLGGVQPGFDLNNSSVAAFRVGIDDDASGAESAVYTWTAAGGLVLVAREDDVINGNAIGEIDPFVALNEAGQVAFLSEDAHYRYTPGTGVEEMLRVGDTIDVGVTATEIAEPFRLNINGSGAFVVQVSLSDGDLALLRLNDPGDFDIIVRTGDLLNGDALDEFVPGAVINDEGQIAFKAEAAGDDVLVRHTDGVGLEEILRTGDDLPDDNFEPVDVVVDGFPPRFWMNNDGHVAFHVGLGPEGSLPSVGFGEDPTSTYVWDGTSLTEILRSLDTVDGLTVQGTSPNTAINDNGDVFFFAEVGGGVDNEGEFFGALMKWNQEDGVQIILKPGDEVTGGTVTTPSSDDNAITTFTNLFDRHINNRGEVAAKVTLDNATDDEDFGLLFTTAVGGAVRAGGDVSITADTINVIEEVVSTGGGDVTLTSTEAETGAAGGLYAIDGAARRGMGDLLLIDPATGDLLIEIGPTGAASLSSLDFHPITGVLYAASPTQRGGTGQLYTVNPTTGATTVVGTHGLDVNDISFDSTGTLYAVAWRESPNIYTLDTTTAAATSVGGDFGNAVGIAFDSSDTLFLKAGDSLRTVDSSTGSQISTIGGTERRLRNVLEFDTASPNVLYSFDESPAEIVTVNPATAALTILSEFPRNGLSAIASNGGLHGVILHSDVRSEGGSGDVVISSASNFAQREGVVSAAGGGSVDVIASNFSIVGEVAAGGEATLSGNQIIDANVDANNVTAASAVISATDGIGAANDPLETTVSQLDATNTGTGGTYVVNSGGLTLEDLDSSGANTLNGGGQITADSPLTISNSITHNSSFTYEAAGSTSAGDDLTVNSGAVVTLDSSANGSLTFRAGDDIAFDAGSVVTTGGGSHRVILRADTEDDVATDSDGGTITQVGGSTTVTTDDLIANGSAGVGTMAQPLQTSVSNLVGRSENGEFHLQNDRDLTIGIDDFGDVTGDPIGPPLAALNDNGEILFRVGDDADVEAETSLALRSSDGTLTSVVVGETPAPGFTMGGLLGGVQPGFDLNNSSVAAFRVGIDDDGSGAESAVYTWTSGGGLVLVAREDGMVNGNTIGEIDPFVALNEAGQVAFLSEDAHYRYTPGTGVEEMLRVGDTIDVGVTADVIAEPFRINLNGSGALVVQVELSDGDLALLRLNDPGDFDIIVRTGDLLNGDALDEFVPGAVINDAGQITFKAEAGGDDVLVRFTDGVGLEEILRTGDDLPDDNFEPEDVVVDGFPPRFWMNNLGHVGFHVGLGPEGDLPPVEFGEEPTATYYWDGTTPTEIVRSLDTIDGLTVQGTSPSTAVNDIGDVFFFAEVGGGVDNEGEFFGALMKWNATDGLEIILKPGDEVTGGVVTSVEGEENAITTFTNLFDRHINNRGEIAAKVTLENATDDEDFGLLFTTAIGAGIEAGALIDVDATGSVTVAAEVIGGGDVMLDAIGGASTLTITDLGGVDATNGDTITLNAPDDILVNGPINEDIGSPGPVFLNSASGDVRGTPEDVAVTASTVTIDGNLLPGDSPGIFNVIGDATIVANHTFSVEIGGSTPGYTDSDHDQLMATGGATIGANVTLDLQSFMGYTPTASDQFVIVDSGSGITGTFANYPNEGDVVPDLLGSGIDFIITYMGGDGNDVVLSVPTPADVLIVDNEPNVPPANPNPPNTSYTDSGNLLFWSNQGYQIDVAEALAGGVTETAVFSFRNLAPGDVYKVAATWSAFGNRATAAPYAVSGVTSPATVPLNQQAAPDDFEDQGVFWETLGTFTVDTDRIEVTLSGVLVGNVIADAVRLEKLVGPEIEVRDGDGNNISTGDTFDFGAAPANSSLTHTFTIANIGPGTLNLSNPMFNNSDFSLVGAFPTMVGPGATETFEVQANTSTSGTLSSIFTFNNDDDDEDPFTINLTEEIVDSLIIDDGDAAYADTMNMSVFPQGFQGDVREATPGNPAQSATYTFEDLPAGTYRISATWTAFSNRATNAAYTIDGGSPILVNQQLPPSNPAATMIGGTVVDQGFSFADLATSFSFGGGDLVVGVSDAGANGNVIIDAIRLSVVTGATIQVTDNATGVGVVSGSTVDFGSQPTNSVLTRMFTIDNVGADPLMLGTPMFNNGQFQIMGGFPTSIGAGMSDSFVVEATDTSSAGNLASTLTFSTNADVNPFVINLAAELVAALIVDDGDPGFVEPITMVRWQQGFQQDVREAPLSDTRPLSATYTFPSLAAGMYRVSATWTAFGNRATNAPYTINGGAAININQRLAPNNPASTPEGTFVMDASGFFFADLDSSFTHGGGDLVVGLSDTGVDGNVIFDAIRVEFLGPQHAETAVEVGRFATDVLDQRQVAPVLDSAVNYWSQIEPAAAARLSNVQVIIKDLPDTVLGLGSYSTPTIWLDSDAAGHGWRLPTSSANTGNGMDLLTVVAHELGHVLGFGDLDPMLHPNHLMSATLGAGTGRVDGMAAGISLSVLPSNDQRVADEVFGGLEIASLRGRLDEADSDELAEHHLAESARQIVPTSPELRAFDAWEHRGLDVDEDRSLDHLLDRTENREKLDDLIDELARQSI